MFPRRALSSILYLLQEEEALARTRIHSTALGTATEDHPSRSQLQREGREQLRRVVEQFDRVSVEDYMIMVIAHYND